MSGFVSGESVGRIGVENGKFKEWRLSGLREER